MKKIFKTFIIAISPVLILSSCTEEDTILGTIKPEVILGSPTDHQEFELGEIIEIQAILKDNIELGSYKIDIHSDSDGHHHRSSTQQWEYSTTGVIDGRKEYQLIQNIQIPAENITEGHYHLGLIVTDKAGNETQSYIEIVVGEHDHH